jgi:hypothetical protein
MFSFKIKMWGKNRVKEGEMKEIRAIHTSDTVTPLTKRSLMAQAVSRRPVTAAARVRALVNPVGFVVDKVALGQVFLRVLQFSPANIIPPWALRFRKLKKNISFTHSSIHSFIIIRRRTIGP